MNRGASTAEIVIIHSGQIVVDQRITMQKLNGCGGVESGFGRESKQFGTFDREKRPEPLSSSEHGISHGLDKARWCRRRHVLRQNMI